jgi:excisionase family DNA binding protein
MPDEVDDQVLTKRQVAELLQVSVSTVERMMRRGTAPPSFVLPGGRARRWLKRDVLRWIESQRGDPGASSSPS